MKLTRDEHRENAEEFISLSDVQEIRVVDRAALAEQMQYTYADAEDVEEIALLIEAGVREQLEHN